MTEPTHDDSPSGAEKQHVFDNPKNVKLLLRVFFAACAVLISFDLFVHRHLSFEKSDVELQPEGWFGFYGLYGFIGITLLVLGAKLMRKVLMRSEDYYDG